MKREQDIFTTTETEIDSLTAGLLNAFDSQIAILDGQGKVVAFNHQWNIFRERLENKWCHPALGVNILQNLQAPLTDGNDFALRFLIGIKEVLAQEVTSFESKCFFKDSNNDHFWFRVKVTHLHNQSGAIIYMMISVIRSKAHDI